MEVEVKGKKYPFAPLLLGAVREFKDETDQDLLEGLLNNDNFVFLLYYGIKWGCKRDKIDFDLSIDDIEMSFTIMDIKNIVSNFTTSVEGE